MYGLLGIDGCLAEGNSCVEYWIGLLVCCIRLCGIIFLLLVFDDCVCWSSATELCDSKLSGIKGFNSLRWQAQHVGT